MPRKLYFVDSYGRVRRDRHAEGARPRRPTATLGRTVLRLLIALAVIVVIAQVIH